MIISEKAWLRYVNLLRAISKKAADQMLIAIKKYGLDDRQKLIEIAYGLASKYGAASAEVSCQMYEAIAEASGVRIPVAEAAETATYREVAIAVNGTLKTQNEVIISNAVGNLVKLAGVDTTMKNALRDGAEWAWVPHGDTCAFCMALASRGWQKASKDAIKNGHAEHIHANCDCTYAVRFDNKTSVGGYDPDEYLRKYQEAPGRNSKEKINSMRREIYKEHKDEINAQKRIAYAARKERENEG